MSDPGIATCELTCINVSKPGSTRQGLALLITAALVRKQVRLWFTDMVWVYLEANLARKINIKQMHFAMCCNQVS